MCAPYAVSRSIRLWLKKWLSRSSGTPEAEATTQPTLWPEVLSTRFVIWDSRKPRRELLLQKYVEGSFTAPALESLDDAAVRARLTAVKGVGPWTADMVLIFGLNRPDVWAQTDFGLRKALEKTGLDAKDPQVWAPWRTAATWLLWQSLTATPVQY